MCRLGPAHGRILSPTAGDFFADIGDIVLHDVNVYAWTERMAAAADGFAVGVEHQHKCRAIGRRGYRCPPVTAVTGVVVGRSR